jgi:hypothetical protein
MIVCPECNGNGWTEDEYFVGGYAPDRWMEIRTQRVECEVCRGWGEIKPIPESDQGRVDLSWLGRRSDTS